MKEKPFISIIIPAYNAEPIIKESIEYETTHRGIHVRAFPADFLHD